MDIRLLTDTVVRHTTVLLAQLATAAGARAPLANLANQVFLDLARELEAQGVRRKVVADMFGLALRSYQLKMQRLVDQNDVQPSLWQGVLSTLEQGSATREELESTFVHASPASLAAILHDLVESGFIYSSGRGRHAVYGVTPERDKKRLEATESVQFVANRLWLLLATGGNCTPEQLKSKLGRGEEHFEPALESLIRSGRVEREGSGDDEHLRALSFHIPVGADNGWEAAVCDHFGAVTTALAAKLQDGRARADDAIGGGTLRFTVHDTHPHKQDVVGLLKKIRQLTDELWEKVSEYNQKHPPPEETTKVTFYFGQHLLSSADCTSSPEHESP